MECKFFVLLDTLEPDDIDDIPYFNEVDTISTITDKDFCDCMRLAEEYRQQRDYTRLIFTKRNGGNSRCRRKTHITILARPRYKSLVKKEIQSQRQQKKQKSLRFQGIQEQIVRNIKNIKQIEPIGDQLLDLIPLDVDALDIDMEKLLSQSDGQELDLDSVSCSSSEGSYIG